MRRRKLGGIAASGIWAYGALMCVVILAFVVTGCGAKEESGEEKGGITTVRLATVEGSQEPAAEDDSPLDEGDLVWQASYFPLENSYVQVIAADDALYGCCGSDGQMRLDRIDKGSLSVSETFVLPAASLDSGIAADREGNIYLPESSGEGAWLWKIDTKGDSQENQKITLENITDENDLFLKGIQRDAKGRLYVWCSVCIPEIVLIENRENQIWHYADRVYVKDEQLKTIYCEEIHNISGVDTMSFQLDAEGLPFFVIKEEKEIYRQALDIDRQAAGERVNLGTALDCFGMQDANLPEHMCATGRGVLYCKDNELIEFLCDEKEKEDILNLTSFGISSSNIIFLAKGEDKIEVIVGGEDSGSPEYIVLALGRTDKKLLTLGMVMSSQDLEQAVTEFNRHSSQYRVEIVDYRNQAESYEEASEKLKLDVIAGKAPDLICLSDINYSIYAGKGVLADLYGFMDADEECPRDILMPSVAKAYEDNGHLYSIAPSFHLHSMWGYGDVTGGRRDVTFPELFGLLEDSGKDLNAIGGFSADEPVLTRLCTVSMDEFVDWDSGTCDFEGDFKELLSFAGKYTGTNAQSSYFQQIREREIVLSVGIISSVADVQIQKELYGKDMNFIGYPVSRGSGTAIAFRGSAVAVNARKENPAAAWEFVKFYLLQGYDGNGFPVVKDQFDQAMASAMEDDFTSAEDGSGTEKLPKESYSTGGELIAVYAATQEEVDMVRELVARGEKKFELHPMIQNIINEEAAAYFSGQVDLDKTVEKIQNRVNLLLQESR